MSLTNAVIDALVASGCTTEQLAAAMKAANGDIDARVARKREADAARKRRSRANVTQCHTDIDGQSVTDTDKTDTPLSPKEIPQTPLEITPYPKTPSPPKGGSFPAGFDRFWELYPNKVGKPIAAKKFVSALRVAPLETIMAGLVAYVAKTDDRPWCNPATWLNQQRWADEPGHVARGSPGGAPNLKDALHFLSQAERTSHDDHGSPESSVRYLPRAAG